MEHDRLALLFCGQNGGARLVDRQQRNMFELVLDLKPLPKGSSNRHPERADLPNGPVHDQEPFADSSGRDLRGIRLIEHTGHGVTTRDRSPFGNRPIGNGQVGVDAKQIGPPGDEDAAWSRIDYPGEHTARRAEVLLEHLPTRRRRPPSKLRSRRTRSADTPKFEPDNDCVEPVAARRERAHKLIGCYFDQRGFVGVAVDEAGEDLGLHRWAGRWRLGAPVDDRRPPAITRRHGAYMPIDREPSELGPDLIGTA